ncbi:HEAT repeat-containing protein 4 isoform X2 [Mastacembelus armatus]|uniref:HEAT repeat-containing protein 4 isoform X2 n=1 Tax=Mastacembelus armatus TaxID=205130 RepID=UPI000E45BAAE|nr:HEAT repeat-containing protein 4 isoform X2 [Mastacembelus armatus]
MVHICRWTRSDLRPAGLVTSGDMGSPRPPKSLGPAFTLAQRSQRLYQRFLTDAATSLTFSSDLYAGRVSYSQADFSHLFRPPGVLTPATSRNTERRLHGLGPRMKARQVLPELPALLESPAPVDHSPPHRTPLLPESCRRTRVMWVRLVNKTPLKNQIILNGSENRRDLQNCSSPALDNTTTDPNNKRETTQSLNRALTNIKDQDQDCVQDLTRPPQSASGAAQVLLLDGDGRKVIQTLLAQLFQHQERRTKDQDRPSDVWDQLSSSEDQPDVQLVSLSSQTTLVRSLLAEQLNSSTDRTRLLACTTLSRLRGPLNKDVVHKLVHLMWSDPSKPVRLAAAQALLTLGKVQEVHRQLRLKLQDRRAEALELVGSLKLMTETLLRSLVCCFQDEVTSVRKQACVTAAALLLQDDTVVSRLLQLLETDPAPEVRLSAITAVGALGLSSPAVQEVLLRCVETEEDAELRLAACRLLPDVGVPLAKLQDFLLQRLNVESSWLVCRTIKEVLGPCESQLQEQRCHAPSISLQGQHFHYF